MADKNSGLITCCRYAYPPNSLSLCGPIEEKRNLNYYTTHKVWDLGTKEILSQFSTLYPYLSLISYENNLRDPFDIRTVEAYWLGNSLLKNISKKSFAGHLLEKINLKRKMKNKDLTGILDKFKYESLPHHSFHVLNIYKRTGHIDIPQTIQTMDACLINYGRVLQILPGKIKIRTQRLALKNEKLFMEKNIIRTIIPQGEKDKELQSIKPGDHISYHWGYFCQKLTLRQLSNLKHYTSLSIRSANLN